MRRNNEIERTARSHLTSIRAVAKNLVPTIARALIAGAGLLLGSLLLFAGFVIALPILGHTT